MLGNRFSLAAFPLAIAGVCSVILPSQTASAQGYQQTKFQRYQSPPTVEPSTQATRTPTFSDSPSDSSVMTADSRGQSTINNPFARYAGTSKVAQASHTFQPQQNRPTQTQSVAQKANDIFGPSALNLDSLPAAKKAPARLAKAEQQSILSEAPLTNTQYPRVAAQSNAVGNTITNPFAKTAFAKDKAAELSAPPELPQLALPSSQKMEAESFDQIPFDIQPKEATSQTAAKAQAEQSMMLAPPATNPGVAPSAPSALAQPRASLQIPETLSPASPPEISGTLSEAENPSADQFFEDQSQRQGLDQAQTQPQTQPQTQNRNVINQLPATQNRQPQSAQPQLAQPQFAQPQFAQPQVQQQVQPTYFQPSPHYAQQASGPISNEWGYGYPEANNGWGQPYVESPTNIFDHGFGNPSYRPNVAQRSVQPTTRNQSILDQGESFDFETKKKEFPPFGEIIATGRFFGSVEVASLRPHFLGNTAISIDGPAFSESIPFEFANEEAPLFRFGFESKYGPGFELNYFNINANSRGLSQTFDGVAPINSIASVTGPNRFSQLSADAIGETFNANHSFELETYSFNVFKEVQFKVSRINGRFGFTYANIAQSLETSVTDGGNNILDSLVSTSDFRGFGPKFGIDYYRPVGHTPLEFITSVTGTGLFGRRDQFVNNTAGLVERRFGADEFVTVVDFNSGIQYKKTTGENRSWYARVSFVHQSWLGGGTAVDPQGDFGLKGLTFGVGYNR